MMEANLIISVSLFSSAKPPATIEDWLALVELLIRILRNTSGSGARSAQVIRAVNQSFQ